MGLNPNYNEYAIGQEGLDGYLTEFGRFEDAAADYRELEPRDDYLLFECDDDGLRCIGRAADHFGKVAQ